MFSALLRRSSHGLALVLLVVTVSACSATPTPGSTTTSTTVSTTTSATTAAKLNLNTATSDQLLATIPGFGNRMVREFQEYRPYTSILQFRQEIGKYVDDAQVAEYEKYVYVPIAVNEADSATLQQIPGLDSTEADALITARPYASNDAFLEKLAAYVSAEELTTAQGYLQ